MKTRASSRHVLKILLWIFAALLTLALIAVSVLCFKGYKMYREAVAERPVAALQDNIRSRCYVYVTCDELPQIYKDAVIAAEDRRFETHHGIDPIAIARAVLVDIKTLSFAEGGSTITQQLAKNELFTQRKHLERKFAEIFAAHAIEGTYTKDEIFEMYVNSIYFGSGYYGIYAAAAGYFGKAPAELNDCESIMLAGLPNAPSIYSPDNSLYYAMKRMTVVLQRMINYDFVSIPEADRIMAEAFSLQFYGRGMAAA